MNKFSAILSSFFYNAISLAQIFYLSLFVEHKLQVSKSKFD